MPGAAQLDPDGQTWTCTRCLTSGFRSKEACVGHMKGAACRAGLSGVRKEAESIAARARKPQIPQESSSIQAAPPRILPLGASVPSAGKPVPFQGTAPRPETAARNGTTNGPCQGCVRLAGEVAALREDVGRLAKISGNHVAHAELMLAQPRPPEGGLSPWLIIGGLAAVAAVVVVAVAASGSSTAPPTMRNVNPVKPIARRTLGFGLFGDLLDVVGKGARTVKALGLV